MPRTFLVIATLLATGAAQAALAKELAKLPAPDQSFELIIDVLPEGTKDDGLVLNKLATLTATVRPLTDSARATTFSDFRLDARMPAHKHGMVTKPVVSEPAPLTFKIAGVKLHMAGDWEFSLSLKAADVPVVWSLPYALK